MQERGKRQTRGRRGGRGKSGAISERKGKGKGQSAGGGVMSREAGHCNRWR